ncbi:MAG: hypothetical protein BZY80_00130 [SAR202 cluster bacterium Io17-Chloro-G2]|nr:MAG: hypothetical protein BZY80_00130 [SAR202 cluster bacterium Io17-Chloro-G2]
MIAKLEQNYYTMSEAAVRLGMSSKQVSELVRHGTLPGIHRIEGSWVISMEEVHAWMDRRSVN